MKTLFLSLLLLSSSAFADEWTPKNTKLEVAYLVLHEIDRRQTLELIKTKLELNPVIGATPSTERVNIYFAATGLAHYYIARELPPEWRRKFQNITIGLAGANLTRNYLVVGVRIPL